MQIVTQSPPIRAVESPLMLVIRRLLRGAMDALASLGVAADRRALAVEADAVHDRHLDRLVYVAALGAQEATVRGCGCHTRFDRVVGLGRGAQHADAVEDGQYDVAFAEVGRGEARLRLVATQAEGAIGGRSE